MADKTRQLEADIEKMKKDTRQYEKRFKDLEISVGRLSENSQASCDDSTAYKESTSSHSGGRSSSEHRLGKTSKQDHDGVDDNYTTKYSSYPVGTVPWIKQTYGARAHQLMVKLSNLGIGECKWPMIFDARCSADNLLPQRILEARFTEAELAKFVMVRFNATKPKDAHGQQLKNADGTFLSPTKTLTGQKEMIEVIGTMALGSFSPSNATRRWTIMLTQAGRRKPDKPESERPVTPAEPESPALPPVSTLLVERRNSGLPVSNSDLQPLATSTQQQRRNSVSSASNSDLQPLATSTQQPQRNSGSSASNKDMQPLATSTQVSPVAGYDSQETRLDFGELPLVVDEEEDDPDRTTELFAKPFPPKKK